MEKKDEITTKRYTCSICGYSHRNVESIVKHIDKSHPVQNDAKIMENEETGGYSYLKHFIERVRNIIS